MTTFTKRVARHCGAAAAAAAALALMLTLPTAPASADCGSTVEQGSYDSGSNTFTPGTAATDDDIRVTCTESDTDGDDVITFDSVDTAVLPPSFGAGSFIVVTLNGTAPLSESTDVANVWVVTASDIQTTGSSEDGVAFNNRESNSLNVEFRGSITTRGDGARGMDVGAWNSDGGSATAINRGTINTHGGVDTSQGFDRTAHAFQAGSTTSTATATNYGHIEARGNAADAMIVYAGSDGTATATNHGTAIVRGGVHIRVNQVGAGSSNVGEPQTAIAVQAYSEGGNAHAVNRGTAEAHGQGSRGIEASAGGYLQTGGTGEALAENFGTVTSTGDLYEVTDSSNQYQGDIREPVGVAAFSQGAGEARAVNCDGGTIETTGDGGRGLFAWSGNDGSGDATAINRGTIVTRGDRVVTQIRGWWMPAIGISAQSQQGDATAVNSGTMNTYGTRAHGVYVEANVGAATATNSGNITTHNTEADPNDPFAYAAYGMWVNAYGGNAEAVNEASGSVTTKGPYGFGLIAQVYRDGASAGTSAMTVNRGRVTTEADDSDGIMAAGWHGGSASNPNAIIARNEATGTITMAGDRSDGVIAWINAGDRGVSYGSVRAENHGTITSSGDANVPEEGFDTDAAVRALFWSWSGDEITDAGDATVVNTGTVTMTGAGATGLGARTFGSGAATANVTDGSVTASAVDDPATTDIDESGIGISAWTGATGTASVTVSGNATVTAPIAARLIGGTTSLLVNNGQLAGDVIFGEGTSTLEVRDFGLITGDVTFGAGGDDTLIFNVLADLGISGITGDITGVEDMIKRGSGTARVNNVTFTGSSLMVEEGILSVRGHLDLGANGTVSVEDAGRLTMEIGDIGADPDDHGQVTAGGGVTLEGDEPAVFASYDPELTEQQQATAREHLQEEGFAPFGEGTDVMAPSGNEVTLRTETETGDAAAVGTISDGTATLDEGVDLGVGSLPEEPVARDTSGSDGTGVVFGSALALAFLLFDFSDDDEEATAGSFAPVPSTLGWAESETAGAHYWVHALTDQMPVTAGTVGSVQGLNMGFTTQLGDGFHLGFSGMPHVQAALGEDTLEGRRYALQGGWRTDDLFANVSLSRGEYMARTAFANLDGLGTLGGTFGLRHEQAQAEVGTRIGIGGLSLDPTLSLVAGSLDREAYGAESAVLRSEVPAFSQRYEGWKARVSLAPTDWLGEGSVRWRPELNLATAQTSTDGPGALSLRQSDKAGVLSFSTPASVEALPQTVHALGTSVSIAKAETWKLRGGYLAMMADGELVHAAVARFKLRF